MRPSPRLRILLRHMVRGLASRDRPVGSNQSRPKNHTATSAARPAAAMIGNVVGSQRRADLSILLKVPYGREASDRLRFAESSELTLNFYHEVSSALQGDWEQEFGLDANCALAD